MLKFNILNIALVLILLIIVVLQLLGFEYWWILLIGFLFLYTVILFLGVVNVRWQFFMPITCRIENNDNNIFLGFDDGPNENTSAILDLLKKHNAIGNFFCTGKHLSENPLLAKRIVDEGHLLANHSFSHTWKFPLKSKNSIVEELEKTNVIIEKLTGKPSQFFRPPFGVTNPTIASAVSKLEMFCIGWSIRTFDTNERDREKILSKIKKNLNSGDIVLLHDHSSQILFILEQLLDFLKTNKFKTQRIDILIQENG